MKLMSLVAFFCFHMVSAAEIPRPLVEQLKQLVEINSGSANISGVRQIQTWLESELKSLGFEVEIGKNNLLIGTLKGKSKGSRVLTMIVHADTVFEPTSPFQHFAVDDQGKIAHGPGVIDDKGGIIVALEGVRRFLKNGMSPFTVKFVSSSAEEAGSPGLADAFRSLSTDSWLVLGFEPALEDGSLIQSRRGNRWYNVKVNGREAHAGRAHKEGANACFALASKLSDISKLTNYDKDLTVSIGHMDGGKDKYNIVCGNAEAKIDTRFSTITDRDRMHYKIEKILNRNDVDGTKTSYEIADDSAPFSPSKDAWPILNQYLSEIQKIEGRHISGGKSGGAADSNAFSRPGILVIDGLGPVGGKMHTADEFVVISSLESRAEALNQFLHNLK